MRHKMMETGLQHSRNIDAISTLAGGIAHNFNNLFMGIQANVSLMLFEIDSAHPNYKRLESIKELIQSGSKLNRQLLGYARDVKKEDRPLSLNKLLEETIDTCATIKNGIHPHREFAAELYEIIGDYRQIKQVVLNLIKNAVDAMPDGGDLFFGTMNVTHRDMSGRSYNPKPGNYVLLTVIDSGMGMDKETMEHIFDPFFTTKGVGKGIGLGLSSVYGIVKAHEGYIDVYSDKGKGTAFEIYLPAQRAKASKENDLDFEVIEIGDPLAGKNEAYVIHNLADKA